MDRALPPARLWASPAQLCIQKHVCSRNWILVAMAVSLGCFWSPSFVASAASEQAILEISPAGEGCSLGNESAFRDFNGYHIVIAPVAGTRCRAVVGRKGKTPIFTVTAARLMILALGPELNDDHNPKMLLTGSSAGTGCCWTDWIVSLGHKPGLVATLRSDTPITHRHLLERTEWWVTDAAFPDAQPVAVLELEGDRWRDVSRRCALYYDEAIADWRQRLAEHAAGDNSENLVLRITLAYLYSGRAVLAWKTLAVLEPPGTLEAQRMEILQRWSRGVLAQAGILH